jgi:hypothetical protein
MLSNFNGPVHVIDGTLPKETVVSQVLQAIKKLTAAFEQTLKEPGYQEISPTTLLPAFPARTFPSVQADGEYREGLRRDAFRNTNPAVPIAQHHEVRYPGGTVISALATNSAQWFPGPFLEAHSLEYDPALQALVLFAGTGKFEFSPTFRRKYCRRHGCDPS